MAEQKKETCGTILLADDGSEHAQAARMLLEELPLGAGCNITVLRVFPSTQASDLAPLKAAVNRTCSLLQAKGRQAQVELLLGSPAEKVVEYADAHKNDLIVVGAKGLRATFGILLGGVAQQVVEYAGCPVLVVRAPYRPLKYILLVTDGSAYSQLAQQFMGRFPLPEGVRLDVMHVLPPPPIPTMIPNSPYGGLMMTTAEQVVEVEAEMRAREEKEGKQLLEEAVQSMQALGLAASGVLQRGDAATEIIEYVKKEGVDMIVTGSRGLSQIRSWLMGNVSRKLVHYSGCSVLVVRAGDKG